MNYTIEKGSPSSLYLFIFTGMLLIVGFSLQLYMYLQDNEFALDFPGDWDKPLGITVGVFLIIRSRKFLLKAKGLFIRIEENELVFRTTHVDPVQRISLNEVNSILGSEDAVVFQLNSGKKQVIRLGEIREYRELKKVRKELLLLK